MSDEYVTLRTGSTRFWWALAAGFADLVVFFPILAIVAATFVSADGDALWILAVFASSVLGAALVARRPKSSQFSVLAVAALWAVPISLVLAKQAGSFVPLAIVGMLSTFLSARHWRLDTGLTSVAVYATGLVVDFAAVFAFHHVRIWESWIPSLTVSGMVSIGILFFSMNENSLESMLLTRDIQKGLPKRMVRFNHVLAVCAVVVLWAVFGIRALQHTAATVWNRLLVAIEVILRRINAWLASLTSSKATPPPRTHPKSLLGHRHPPALPKPVHPSLLSYIIMGMIATLAVALVLWSLVRFLIPLLRRLFRDFDSVSQGAEAGYVDEFERLKPLRRRRRLMANPAGFKKTRESEPTTPAEWVRYLYRKTVKGIRERGGHWEPSLTVEEVLCETPVPDDKPLLTGGRERLKRLYNEARYGTGRIAEKDVALLQGELDSESK